MVTTIMRGFGNTQRDIQSLVVRECFLEEVSFVLINYHWHQHRVCSQMVAPFLPFYCVYVRLSHMKKNVTGRPDTNLNYNKTHTPLKEQSKCWMHPECSASPGLGWDSGKSEFKSQPSWHSAGPLKMSFQLSESLYLFWLFHFEPIHVLQV